MRYWKRLVSVTVAAGLAMTLMAKPAWRHRYAEVNGVRLHYVEQGKGPLILFLHGFPEFWYAWKDLLPNFAKDHKAVALDMRGYNLSSKPESLDAYRVPVIVEDVRALAQKLGARKFVLVGHDWGGVIAWAFALSHPDLLEKLVVINAPHPAVFVRELASNPAQQKASAYFNLFASPQAETTLSQNNFERVLKNLGPLLTEEDRKEYLAAWNQPGALTGGLNYYRAARLRSPVDGAKPEPVQGMPQPNPIEVPTLVIWGEKDTALLTGNLNGLEEHVRHLQVRRVPDGSHWVIHEKPDLVIRHMREFLGK
jgi:pimeloyl-ACP methyl ester carboxylesterase